jgi:hypothetical protein
VEARPYGVLAPSEEATAIMFRGKVFCAGAGLELPERAAVEDKWWHVAGGEVVYAQEDDVVIPSGDMPFDAAVKPGAGAAEYHCSLAGGPPAQHGEAFTTACAEVPAG